MPITLDMCSKVCFNLCFGCRLTLKKKIHTKKTKKPRASPSSTAELSAGPAMQMASKEWAQESLIKNWLVVEAPIWKICSPKWVHLPQFSGWKFQKSLKFHHQSKTPRMVALPIRRICWENLSWTDPTPGYVDDHNCNWYHGVEKAEKQNDAKMVTSGTWNIKKCRLLTWIWVN